MPARQGTIGRHHEWRASMSDSTESAAATTMTPASNAKAEAPPAAVASAREAAPADASACAAPTTAVTALTPMEPPLLLQRIEHRVAARALCLRQLRQAVGHGRAERKPLPRAEQHVAPIRSAGVSCAAHAAYSAVAATSSTMPTAMGSRAPCASSKRPPTGANTTAPKHPGSSSVPATISSAPNASWAKLGTRYAYARMAKAMSATTPTEQEKAPQENMRTSMSGRGCAAHARQTPRSAPLQAPGDPAPMRSAILSRKTG